MKDFLKKYVKYDGMWREYDEKTPLECATLHSVISFGKQVFCDIRNCEIVEIDDYENLDWYGTEIYDDKFETGWLAPDGKFFGCQTWLHRYQACFVHRLQEKDMETAGFVKLTYLYGDREKLIVNCFSLFLQEKNITNKQYEYLKRSNITNFKEVEEMRAYLSIKSAEKNFDSKNSNNDDSENTPTM